MKLITLEGKTLEFKDVTTGSVQGSKLIADDLFKVDQRRNRDLESTYVSGWALVNNGDWTKTSTVNTALGRVVMYYTVDGEIISLGAIGVNVVANHHMTVGATGLYRTNGKLVPFSDDVVVISAAGIGSEANTTAAVKDVKWLQNFKQVNVSYTVNDAGYIDSVVVRSTTDLDPVTPDTVSKFAIAGWGHDTTGYYVYLFAGNDASVDTTKKYYVNQEVDDEFVGRIYLDSEVEAYATTLDAANSIYYAYMRENKLVSPSAYEFAAENGYIRVVNADESLGALLDEDIEIWQYNKTTKTYKVFAGDIEDAYEALEESGAKVRFFDFDGDDVADFAIFCTKEFEVSQAS